MTHYPDLSGYSYQPSDVPMLNVGWLDSRYEYPQGDVAPAAVQGLIEMAERPHAIMRGVHDCQFCEIQSPIRQPARNARGHVTLGTGELHVTGSAGTTYAAPTLIIHYVLEHQYLPPAPFLDALTQPG